MSDVRTMTTVRPMIGLLLRVKARSIYNQVRHAATDAPLRLGTAVMLIVVIWLGLYGLFHMVLRQLERTPLEATIAIPLVFNFFFVAMLVMLMLSNAIIAYGALFGKQESDYLIASPLTTLDVVTLKYLEGLVLASSILVSESVASGLLRPYRADISVDGAGYSALCVPGRERHPPVKAFFEWLRLEARQSGHACRLERDA